MRLVERVLRKVHHLVEELFGHRPRARRASPRPLRPSCVVAQHEYAALLFHHVLLLSWPLRGARGRCGHTNNPPASVRSPSPVPDRRCSRTSPERMGFKSGCAYSSPDRGALWLGCKPGIESIGPGRYSEMPTMMSFEARSRAASASGCACPRFRAGRCRPCRPTR